MKLVIQRVNSARVTVDSKVVGEIGKGLFVLFGSGMNDTKKEAEVLAEKLIKLRIMSDDQGKMNLSVVDINASILVVSQFTLYADTTGGNRPSFVKAKEPKEAEALYEYFIKLLKDKGVNVQTGSFGEYMKINCELDGPVTIVLETEKEQGY